MIKSGVKSISFHTPLHKLLFLSFLLFVSLPFVTQAMNLTLSHTPYSGNAENYSLTWDAVNPSTTNAIVTYDVYGTFPGAPTIHLDTTDQTSDVITTFIGDRCFYVISSDSLDPSAHTKSKTQCHSFIHDLTGEGIKRADGDGTERGVNQAWTITYSLDVDAYMTANIYAPGTIFTTDPVHGFIQLGNTGLVRSLVDHTARSGEMAGLNVEMSEFWDSRSSSGTIVPNGIYWLAMSALVDTTTFNGSLPIGETYQRSTILVSIPVDIIRIMNLAATGITLSNPSSNISYFLTGDALVRLLIAQPGSHFTVDSNGDIQPVNSLGAIDNTLIVSTKTFQRKAGANSEIWDGKSSTGTAMPSGVYAVGISANDPYGNHAIDNSGNDGPIFTTLTLEKSAGSAPTGPGTTPDTTPPTATPVYPTNNQPVNMTVSTVSINLVDAGGSGLNVITRSNFDVTDNLGNSYINTAQLISPPQSNGVYQLIFNPPLTGSNVTYTVTLKDIQDVAGNPLSSSPPTSYTAYSFTINIANTQSSIQDSLKIYPNPAKAQNSITITYSLGVPTDVTIDIFNVAGERVRSFTFSDSAPSVVTHSWLLDNSKGDKVGSGVYIIRINPTMWTSKRKWWSSDERPYRKILAADTWLWFCVRSFFCRSERYLHRTVFENCQGRARRGHGGRIHGRCG